MKRFIVFKTHYSGVGVIIDTLTKTLIMLIRLPKKRLTPAIIYRIFLSKEYKERTYFCDININNPELAIRNLGWYDCKLAWIYLV